MYCAQASANNRPRHAIRNAHVLSTQIGYRNGHAQFVKSMIFTWFYFDF